MLLGWSGVPTDPDSLAPGLFLPERGGTLAPLLLATARNQGRVAVPVRGLVPILRELAAGHPVLVLQDLAPGPFELWHYAVVVGYDLDAQLLLLHSGGTSRRRQSLRSFERSFAAPRFALVVLPPEELPASSGELHYLEAVAGVERAGRTAEAERAYRLAAMHWPQSPLAWMGLGNARYRLGDLEAAGEAFARAAELESRPAAALNNLAQVRLEQGRIEEAARAIERALALASGEREALLDTQREIEAARPSSASEGARSPTRAR